MDRHIAHTFYSQVWPQPDLQAFTLKMAAHGFPVSCTLMNYDKGYALEQLQQAHTLADEPLRELAVEMFRHFERRQVGAGVGAFAAF